MGLRIRRFQVEDFDQVLELCRALHAESPRYNDKPFSEAKARALLTGILTSWTVPMIGIVAEDDGAIVGMLGGRLAEHALCDEPYATDIGIFVLPAYRGTSAFPRMMKVFEDWAFSQGVREIAPGVSTGIQAEEAVRIYGRLGYTVVSYGMIKKRSDNV